jgi:hypothetical protein
MSDQSQYFEPYDEMLNKKDLWTRIIKHDNGGQHHHQLYELDQDLAGSGESSECLNMSDESEYELEFHPK